MSPTMSRRRYRGEVASAHQSNISVRPLLSHEDFDKAVVVQRQVWGYLDLELDSRTILAVAARFAGQVLGAFDENRLIGLSLAFATIPPGRLHSQSVGIHPDYQNRGIGRMLKLAQRADALARDIDLIQWTFDPLQALNAHFNLVRLGGVAKTYIPNFYGITSSPLHGGMPTDRLLIEWQLESDRVQRILAGEPPVSSRDVREIRLPAASQRLDPVAQATLREQFLQCFNEGYAACDFRNESDVDIYVLERP